MAKVNLAKALKMKNALVGEINRLKEILARENSRLDTSTSNVDCEAVWTQLHDKTGQLVALKTKIATANIGIYSYLSAMEEARSLISYIKTLNTTDGIQRIENRFGNGPATEIKHIAYLKQEDVDSEVAKATKLLEQAQDAVDAYNAITFIDV